MKLQLKFKKNEEYQFAGATFKLLNDYRDSIAQTEKCKMLLIRATEYGE